MNRKLLSSVVFVIFVLLSLLCLTLPNMNTWIGASAKALITAGFFVLASILYVPSVFIDDYKIQKRVFILDGILAVFALIWAIYCLSDGFIWSLMAAAMFVGNILYGRIQIEKQPTEEEKKKLVSQESERLAQDIEINKEDNTGKTPLIIAAYSNYENIIEVLIEKGEDLNAQDKDGKTALIWASYYGYHKIVKTLLLKGANKEIKDNNGNNALDYAKKRVHTEVIKLLESAEIKK